MTLGCVAASAHAESWLQFEAGIGGSAYSQIYDGVWVQDGLEHHLNLTAPAVEAGLTGDIYQAGHWGASWHLDYAWLGAIHSQGLATSDANYDPVTKKCVSACGPLADFTGSGHDSGVLLTIEPHFDYAGWRVGVEAGPYLHTVTWSVDANNQRENFTMAPRASHFESETGWHLGYVAGVSVEYKRFSLKYQYFKNGPKGGDPNPPIWTNTHVVTVGYRF